MGRPATIFEHRISLSSAVLFSGSLHVLTYKIQESKLLFTKGS